MQSTEEPFSIILLQSHEPTLLLNHLVLKRKSGSLEILKCNFVIDSQRNRSFAALISVLLWGGACVCHGTCRGQRSTSCQSLFYFFIETGPLVCL